MDITNLVLLVLTLLVSCFAACLAWKNNRLQERANVVSEMGLDNQAVEIRKSDAADVTIAEILPEVYRGPTFVWPKYVRVRLINTSGRVATNVSVGLQVTDKGAEHVSRKQSLNVGEYHDFKFEAKILESAAEVPVSVLVSYQDSEPREFARKFWLISARGQDHLDARELIRSDEEQL